MESVISDQTSPLSEHAGVEPGRVAEHYQAGGDSEQQVNGMDFGALNQSDAELHRFCSEGNLDEVRVMLSRSLEGLESLDPTTGCTPIVLAIRNNHPEVVRELLSAGAIVPPPGLTSHPLLLSILYPQQMYGMPPPHYMGQHLPMPSDFLPQQNFFPDQDGHRGMYMPFQPQSSRKESSPNAQANLPPSDVARTIPCRNYPNCKYGAGCVFYHPRSSGPVSGFYSGPPSFAPNGPYNPAYVPLQPNGMSMPGQYYIPNNFPIQPQQHVNQDQSPPEQHQQQTPQEYQHQHQHQPQTQQQIQSDIPEASTTQHDHTQSQSVPSAIAPPFVPAFNTPQPSDLSSPPPPSQFGGSLMSPSMLATSPIAIPSAEAFLAASPTSSIFMSPTNGPNGFMPGMNGNSHFRRQSLNQQSFGMQVKPFGHGKKLSFSGVPRPYGQGRTSSGAGSWKDGNPPPCAFFGQGKCRNGELCKFPHLDADGNDCRHPDVVRGIIPPLPTLSRQPRGIRMMHAGRFGSFDPSLRQYQQQQQFNILQQQPPYSTQGQQSNPKPITDGLLANIEVPTSETIPEQDLSASVLPQPTAGLTLPIVRSSSHPGLQRVHAHGSSSRAESPAPSNVSFHGNGHPRRASARAPFASGGSHDSRSSSSGAEVSFRPQRVPSAQDFPALNGTTSPNGDKADSPIANGKTAAQVLSLPAPSKPVSAKVSPSNGHDDGDHEGLTMTSEPDSDAVIVSRRPSNTSSSIPAVSPPADPTRGQRGSISFATAALSPANAIGSPPVSVRA